jgi:hypothetical protein
MGLNQLRATWRRTPYSRGGEFVRFLRRSRRLFNTTSLLLRVLALVSLGQLVVFSAFVVLADALFYRALLLGSAFFVIACVVSWIIVVRMVRPVKDA